MRVALCVSGDFLPTSKAMASVCAHILPTETVDVFAFLWTQAETDEQQLRAWLDPQLSARVTLRRWTFDTIRPLNEWTKFAAKYPKVPLSYFEDVSRIEWGLQSVSQLKAQQENADGQDYDAVVHIDSRITIGAAPPLSHFTSILNDHVVFGRFEIMPWWPAYDYGVAMTSSRNMEVYGAIQTMHRRHYFLRHQTVDIKAAFVNHFYHARLKVCSVLMRGA